MLWRESVVDRNDCTPGAIRELTTQVIMSIQITNAKSAAVNEDHDRQLSGSAEAPVSSQGNSAAG